MNKKQHKKQHINRVIYNIGDKLVCKKNINIFLFIEGQECIITSITYDINNYMALYHVCDGNDNYAYFTYDEVIEFFCNIKELRKLKLEKLNA